MAQFGSVPALGAGGRRFESSHPDFFSGKFLRMEIWKTLFVLEVLGENFEIMENLGEFLKSFYIRKPLSPVSSHICAGVDLYILS